MCTVIEAAPFKVREFGNSFVGWNRLLWQTAKMGNGWQMHF